MTDQIQISRFDYVRQGDGSFDWCVEVTVVREDQFSPSGTREDRYGPLTPEDAKSKFDVDLSTVLDGINSDAHKALVDAQAELVSAKADLSMMQASRDEIQTLLDAKTALLAQVYSALTPHVDAPPPV